LYRAVVIAALLGALARGTAAQNRIFLDILVVNDSLI
jgi:hypothetical protein